MLDRCHTLCGMMCSWVSRRHDELRDQVREGLAELIRLVNDPATPTSDVREVLSDSKALGAQVSVLQADAAVVVSARERHGDSGVGVLARSAGLSRRDAAGQVQTAQSLQSMPAVRDAVETGQICCCQRQDAGESFSQDERRPGKRRRRVVGEGR